MDTSKEYALMCKEAEEIQEFWDFKDGDYIFDPRDESVDVWAGYDAHDFPGYPSREYNGGIWLPRKDQLMELSGKSWQNFNFHIAQDPYRFEMSEERAGLSYIMMTKYNKKWNGEKWIME